MSKMLSFITSALGRLLTAVNPLSETEPHHDQQEESPRNTQPEVPSQTNTPLPSQHYPRNATDVHKAITYLKRASSYNLPAEILKLVLFHADYDCLHFTSTLSKQVNAISRTAVGPPAKPCVETPPIRRLAAASHTLASGTIFTGRLRSVHLKFTGRDQGWTSDPQTASWSWFEIGKRRSESGEVRDRLVLAHNTIAGQDWRAFEIFWHADEELSQDVSEDLKEWFGELEDGDMVSIVPMARYAGWQCRVLKASIDVEVEIWW